MKHKLTYEELENQFLELQKQHEILELKLYSKNESKIKEKLHYEQHLFKTLMDNMPDHIYFKDTESKFIRSNKAQAKEFGFDDPNEIIGKSDFDFFTEKRAQKGFEDEQAIIRNGKSIINQEEKLKWSNGKTAWVSATKIVLNDNNGKVIGTFGLSRDITDQKNSEIKLLKANKELNKLNETKNTLFSIIGHDLRGPFSNVLGLSELILENINGLETDELKNFVGLIKSTAENTLILLDNLLNWANSQTKQIIFDPQKIDLYSIFQEIQKLKNSMAEAKDISLNFSSADRAEVYADKNMMKLILRNLIANAIKFTNIGGKIDVTGTSKQDCFEITIADNGVGMNEEKCKNIFELANKETTLGTAKEKGSGLGLMLCKEFVEKHGGKIWVESEEGKGSNFTFTLPLNKNHH